MVVCLRRDLILIPFHCCTRQTDPNTYHVGILTKLIHDLELDEEGAVLYALCLCDRGDRFVRPFPNEEFIQVLHALDRNLRSLMNSSEAVKWVLHS